MECAGEGRRAAVAVAPLCLLLFGVLFCNGCVKTLAIPPWCFLKTFCMFGVKNTSFTAMVCSENLVFSVKNTSFAAMVCSENRLCLVSKNTSFTAMVCSENLVFGVKKH